MNKVLIIEDDLVVANIYRNKLVVAGFSVETANDGQLGLEMVRSFRPDVVLLDLMLPKVPGIEVIKQIRSEADFQQLPFIVLSNTYLTSVVQEAWKAGATKCLSKANCTPVQVVEVIRDSLTLQREPTGSVGQVIPPAAGKPNLAPARKETPSGDDPDAEFQTELRASFNAGLPATLVALRAALQRWVKAGDEADRLKQIKELYRRIHALTGNAAVVGLHHLAQISEALEALLKELLDKPQNINTSTLRTVASAIDCLGVLSERRSLPRRETHPVRALVVDDEAISRRAVTYALDKAKLKSVSVEDPIRALALLSENKFDLVVLDVDMPNMNGYELCSKLRALHYHKKTPVVFVTSLNDLESRAHSTMSGGNDFIAKPFLFIELAVKALVYIARSQLAAAKP